MINLKWKVKNLEIRNPILLASGTCGYGIELKNYLNFSKIGGLVTKGLSLHPRKGNQPPRIFETTGGILNSIGLENIGVQNFVKEILPKLREFDCVIFVNIFGEKIEEYVEIAKILDGIDGLELNVSCPNVKKGGVEFGKDKKTLKELVQKVRKVTSLPLIVKLSPMAGDLKILAKVSEDEGADAITLINTLRGIAIDIKTAKPILGGIFGGLSGPAIKPVALAYVYEISKIVSIPIIGSGGIMNTEDALEFLYAGAKGVQIGTATLINPKAGEEIAEGLKKWSAHHAV